MIEQNASIRFNKKVAHGTFLMALESSEITATASPGQFVMVRVREGTDPLLRRPFSICAIEGDGLFLILYRVVGHGTSILSEAGKGDKLSVLGPLGKGFEMPPEHPAEHPPPPTPETRPMAFQQTPGAGQGEVISAKLDTIKAILDMLNERVKKIEKIAEAESEKAKEVF